MLNKSVLVLITGWLMMANTLAKAEGLLTAEVREESVSKYIYLDGHVEAVQQATLFAQTSGRVIKLNYDVDNAVKKGSVIALLRDTEQKARLKQATAGLDAAEAQFKDAELEYNRVTDLFEKKLVAASMRDKADAGLKSAQAQLNAAKARFEEAKEQLNHTVIRAPYDGTVTKRHIEVGETLQIGQPIISGLAKQDALRFNVHVPQRLITKVKNNTQVDIILPEGTHLKSDQVTVFPTMDLVSHTIQLRAQVFTNQFNLHPGMFVKVGIPTDTVKELLIPESSVVHRSELTGVYIVDKDQQVSLRQVRLGGLHGTNRIVLAGLSAGEQLATDPNQAAKVIKQQRQGE